MKLGSQENYRLLREWKTGHSYMPLVAWELNEWVLWEFICNSLILWKNFWRNLSPIKLNDKHFHLYTASSNRGNSCCIRITLKIRFIHCKLVIEGAHHSHFPVCHLENPFRLYIELSINCIRESQSCFWGKIARITEELHTISLL